jgi:hypothetical protein
MGFQICSLRLCQLQPEIKIKAAARAVYAAFSLAKKKPQGGAGTFRSINWMGGGLKSLQVSASHPLLKNPF